MQSHYHNIRCKQCRWIGKRMFPFGKCPKCSGALVKLKTLESRRIDKAKKELEEVEEEMIGY